MSKNYLIAKMLIQIHRFINSPEFKREYQRWESEWYKEHNREICEYGNRCTHCCPYCCIIWESDPVSGLPIVKGLRFKRKRGK